MSPQGLSRGAQLCALALALAACSAGAAPPEAAAVRAPHDPKLPREVFRAETQADQIQAGRKLAIQQCSGCHALGSDSNSPNPDAPPLRSALWRYDGEVLATRFIEGLRIGHGDMPVFDFNVIGADALIAYLKSIRSPRDLDQK